MMRAWREWAPGVAIQIPPNLESRWDELLDELDDLGGISWAKDEVNPTRPWEKLEQYQRICETKGRELVERLPVYASHSGEEWLTDRWHKRVKKFWEESER